MNDQGLSLGTRKICALDRERIIYQSFLHSNEAIVICDPRGTLLYVNKAFCDLFGYGEGDVIGQNASVLRHPSMPSSLFRGMWKENMNRDKGHWRGEVCNRHKDGAGAFRGIRIGA
ncbi:MAG: PAS domain S-box protein [SAR324 cluster bacterium]|nr:PAS domain S-box protein [SAR324 cluster bacterium]